MRVLVAVDESGFARHAVESVAARNWSETDEFLVLNVMQPMPMALSDLGGGVLHPYETVQPSIMEHHQEIVDNSVAFLKEHLAPHKIKGKVVEGIPIEAIVAIASEWGADLIVMGSHGRTGWKKLLLGSVAEAVSSTAKCKVEIVRKDPTTHHTGGSHHI